MAGVELLLEGKTALITGGSRGIGAETVRLFRAAGARVAFSYRQAREQAAALAEECGGTLWEAGAEGPVRQGSGIREQGSELQGLRETGAKGEELSGSSLGGIPEWWNKPGASFQEWDGTAASQAPFESEIPQAMSEFRIERTTGSPLPGTPGRAMTSMPAAGNARGAGSSAARGRQTTSPSGVVPFLGRSAETTIASGATSAPEPAETDSAEDDGGRLVACVGIEQELETPADGRRLVEKAVRALGRLDILVVNHGIWPPEDAPIATMSEEQWRRTLGVNLDAVFGLVQAAVGVMQGQRDKGQGTEGQGPGVSDQGPEGEAVGHIVLISSTAGQRGEAFHADYAASKGALISLTKSLSSELAGRGIRVNCVAPGWVETEMSAGTLKDPELGTRVRAGIPVGRAATPREIAGPVLFLCTPLAGFISGEVLNVNGGAVLAG